jgi:hypothetical protein
MIPPHWLKPSTSEEYTLLHEIKVRNLQLYAFTKAGTPAESQSSRTDTVD